MSEATLLLISGLAFVLVVVVVVRVVPVVRRGRVVVLDRPKPCSRDEAQHFLDRLVSAGIDAEIVEHADNGLNVWANVQVAGQVTPDERYVIQVPRRQVAIASKL